MKTIVGTAVAVFVAGTILLAQTNPLGFWPGYLHDGLTLERPRVAPLPSSEWTERERATVARYPKAGGGRNQLETLLRHPDLVESLLAVETYFAEQSELSPRHREILILRTAWNCQSEYLWAQHVPLARRAGLSDEEIRNIARGASAFRSDEHDLIVAADNLWSNSFLIDDFWRPLSKRLTRRQLMDLVFTVPAFELIATINKSLGVQIEDTRLDRRPKNIRWLPVAYGRHPLTVARIPPLEASEWTPEVRSLLDPTDSGRPVLAVYRTFAQHPKLYAPRQLLSEHIRMKNTLPPRLRELIILRMGWLSRSEYEWAQHVRAGRAAGLDTKAITLGSEAPGWSAEEIAVMRATDEIKRNHIVSNETWATLASHFDTRQLMDILATAGGYRMVSTALNTFGVQLEPGNERFP